MGRTTRNIVRVLVIGTAIVFLASCGGGDRGPASPSPTTSVVAPGPQTHNVAGIVRSWVSSPTIADARIEVVDGPNAGRFATSDAEGQYVLTALIDGRLRLRASRAGYAPVEQTIDLVSHTTLNFTLVSGSACSVSGVVQESPAGAPSAGAIVELVKEPGGYSAPAIVSEATGTTGLYRLDGIQCAIALLLRVEKPDFFDYQQSVLINGDTQRDITIERVVYPLQGFVRDSASGHSLVSATVEIVSGPYAGREATTRVDGSYALSARDSVTVRASKAGYQFQDGVVTVAAPATYKDFSLPPAP